MLCSIFLFNDQKNQFYSDSEKIHIKNQMNNVTPNMAQLVIKKVWKFEPSFLFYCIFQLEKKSILRIKLKIYRLRKSLNGKFNKS